MCLCLVPTLADAPIGSRRTNKRPEVRVAAALRQHDRVIAEVESQAIVSVLINRRVIS
jgi:hypothetical protein